MVAYYLPKALAKKAAVTYYPSFDNARSYAANVLKVYGSIAKRAFNVFHFNCTPGWTNGRYLLPGLAQVTGVATLMVIHGINQIEYIMDLPHTKNYRSAILKGATNIIRSATLVDQVVTYSEFMRSQIVHWYGIKREKIAVIPNGVDLNKFKESASNERLEGDPAILYLGHLSNFKGVDLLIHAVSRVKLELPNLKLHIVGHGNIPAYEQLANKENVEKAVVFHGYAKPELTARYFKSADFCIFPSRRDSFGITLMEAMASGVPVIASNRGGTPEIINSKEIGLLFEPDDPEDLHQAILALSQDSNLRKRLSSNALNRVSNYSWEKIANKYLSLYKELTD